MNSHAAQNKSSAQELAELRARADAGEASAQFELGWMYANGQGVPQDDAEAITWYRRAAEQGNAVAQFNLGWMYATAELRATRRAFNQDVRQRSGRAAG